MIKMLLYSKNSLETERKNVISGNLCIMKANVRRRQRSYLSLYKEDLPIQSIISGCSENSEYLWRSHFSIEFS